MFPLLTFIDCLLNGASRIPAGQRAEVLCTMLAALLPQMTDTDVNVAREHVVGRLWPSIELAEPVLNLIDGHLELRALLHMLASDGPAEDYDESAE